MNCVAQLFEASMLLTLKSVGAGLYILYRGLRGEQVKLSFRERLLKLRSLLKRGEQREEEEENIEEVVKRELRTRESEFKARRERLILELSTRYNVVDHYHIEDPWARVFILEDKKTGAYLYMVDEIPMTEEERDAYNKIMTILNWELKPLSEEELEKLSKEGRYTSLYEIEREYFIRQVKRIVNLYRIRFGGLYEAISWGKILYYLIRDTVGYGVIDPLMKDEYIEDISCDGVGKPIYVWHQKYESLPTNIKFTIDSELDKMVLRLAHKAGKHISVAFPILDAILPEGHRLAATYRREVSTSGSTFTIRKFREKPLSIVDLLNHGSISPELGAYFWLAMEYKMPGMIMGVTGAGKTTMLNALATLFRPNIKVVTIEDTPELKLTLENWVQLTARPSYSVTGEKVGEITLYDLVRVSLRYRPDVIIVGEVRGEEAYVLFQAMATGHGGLTTIHAEHIDAMVKRLTSPPMNIPPSYVPLLRWSLVVKRIRLVEKGGHSRTVRRVTDVWEIRDYEDYVQVAKWNVFTREHEFYPEKSIILQDISGMSGMTKGELMEELKRRADVLRWMMKKDIRDYKQVANVITKYYSNPDALYKQVARELRVTR